MTITFVGAGTAATAVNASVTPVAHASTAVGDLVLVYASIRNSGAGAPNLPTGWAALAGAGNALLFGKIWQSGDVIPAVTFTGGVANADTIGQTVTLRGVEPRLPDAAGATAVALLNGSAQNVAYPALDVPGNAHAVLLGMWKQDDNTAVSTPATFTSAVATSVTAGDDASQALRYVIQTTEADVGASSLTITGGAAAISRSFLLAFRPAAALVVTVQDSYPPRIVLAVSGLTVGDQLELFREVAGVRTAVRAGAFSSVTDTGIVVIDGEQPFGVPVRYVAVVNGTVEYESDPATYTLTGGKVAMSDAVTGAAAEVVIMSMDPATFSRNSARFRVNGRNLMVAGPFAGAEGSLEVFTETTAARDDLVQLLAAATEGIVLVRSPDADIYEGVDGYYALDRAVESRWSQDGSDPRRLTALEYALVDGWAADLAARGFTYGEVEAYYAGQTYAAAAGDFPTYFAALQGDFS